MHNPRVTRLFLWYNKSVRLRNKFAHGDNVGKKTQYSKQMMAEALKSRAAFFNSGGAKAKNFYKTLVFLKVFLKKLY